MVNRFCDQCGQELPNEASRFCPACGSQVLSSDEEEPVYSELESVSDEHQEDTNPEDISSTDVKSSDSHHDTNTLQDEITTQPDTDDELSYDLITEPEDRSTGNRDTSPLPSISSEFRRTKIIQWHTTSSDLHWPMMSWILTPIAIILLIGYIIVGELIEITSATSYSRSTVSEPITTPAATKTSQIREQPRSETSKKTVVKDVIVAPTPVLFTPSPTRTPLSFPTPTTSPTASATSIPTPRPPPTLTSVETGEQALTTYRAAEYDLRNGDYESAINWFSVVIETDPRETWMPSGMTDIVLNSHFYRAYAYNELEMHFDAEVDLRLINDTAWLESYLLDVDEVVDRAIISFNTGWTAERTGGDSQRYYSDANYMCREAVKGNNAPGSNLLRPVDCKRWIGQGSLPDDGGQGKPYIRFDFIKQADWKNPLATTNKIPAVTAKSEISSDLTPSTNYILKGDMSFSGDKWTTFTDGDCTSDSCLMLRRVSPGGRSTMILNIWSASDSRFDPRMEGSTISFWVKTSLPSCCESLKLLIGGNVLGEWTGNSDWTLVSVPIPPNRPNNVQWTYTRTNTVESGISNSIWIKDIHVE